MSRKCSVISNSVSLAQHDFWKATSTSGRFINLKFMAKILDRINSIRAVSSNDRSTLLSRFLGIKHVRMHSGN